MHDEQQQPRTPGEASREGLEELDPSAHQHPTTQHDKAPNVGAPPAHGTPGEAHRGGPLPDEKK